MSVTKTSPPPSLSLGTNATDIRDLKPPVDIPSGWEWLWWTLGALVIAAIAFALWRYLRKRREQVAFVSPVPAHVRAKQKLQEALALIAQPKPFCIAVSDAVRYYLEERFEFRAPERTTEEFLYELQRTNLLTRDQKDSLGAFLQSCDMVKFAQYEPGEPELHDLHSSAVRLIEETELPETQTPPPMPEKTFTTPAASVDDVLKKAITPRSEPSKGKALAIIGTLLQLAPCIWVFAYFVTLFRLLKLLANPHPADLNRPFEIWSTSLTEMNSILGNAIGFVLAGLVVGVIGLVLLVISLTSSRYRAEWFFWFLIVYGVFLIGAFPIGTAIGIFFLVYCLANRRDFFNQQPVPE